MENSTSTNTSAKVLPKAWMQALHRKLAAMYMDKFTRFFSGPELTEDWYSVWGEGLASLTGEQIKVGLSVVQQMHPIWPPTLPEFKACCKASAAPSKPMLEAPKHGHSPHAEECMRKIREMLANPKKPGTWWKQEILDKHARGERVSMIALEMARS